MPLIQAEETPQIGEHEMSIIKVSATSRTAAVAGAVAGVIRESGRAEVQAIGAGAVNQAIKAIAIARGYLLEENMDIICTPSFVEVDIEGHERTALRVVVEPRPIVAGN
ncbi:MAG: stage V sporulation protein S [Candidatus Promineifilaceae bacterium]